MATTAGAAAANCCQSGNRRAPLTGQLLIASPSIHDPNFRRTVVYMTEHGEAGAMGLILNRVAQTTVAEAVPDLSLLASDDAPVYVGGPVAAVIAIAVAAPAARAVAA